jgi:hypothetical protein
MHRFVFVPLSPNRLGVCECGGVILEAPYSKKARCHKCNKIGRFVKRYTPEDIAEENRVLMESHNKMMATALTGPQG